MQCDKNRPTSRPDKTCLDDVKEDCSGPGITQYEAHSL